jgi:hypothetical protein
MLYLETAYTVEFKGENKIAPITLETFIVTVNPVEIMFLIESVLYVVILKDEEGLKEVGFIIPLILKFIDKVVILELKKQFKI